VREKTMGLHVVSCLNWNLSAVRDVERWAKLLERRNGL